MAIFDNANRGGDTLVTGQVSVTSSATAVVAASSGNRQSITIVNGGTVDVFLGPTSGVTTSTGVLLAGVKGQTITLPYSGALYAICGTTATISYAVVG